MEKIMFTVLLPTAAAIAIISLFILLFRSKTRSAEYDERQVIIRGKGFKYAYYTMSLSLFVFSLLQLNGVLSKVDTMVVFSICLLVSLCVFVNYCIFKDAFFGFNQSGKSVSFYIVSGIIFSTILVKDILNSGFQFEYNITQLCLCLLYLSIGITSLLKNQIDRRESIDEKS